MNVTHYRFINGAYAPTISSLCDLDLLELGLGHTAYRTEVGIVQVAEGHELFLVVIYVSTYFASVNCHDDRICKTVEKGFGRN